MMVTQYVLFKLNQNSHQVVKFMYRLNIWINVSFP